MSVLRVNVKLSGNYSDWNIVARTNGSTTARVPQVYQSSEDEYILVWSLPVNIFNTKITFTPKAGTEPNKEYSAVITDVYIEYMK